MKDELNPPQIELELYQAFYPPKQMEFELALVLEQADLKRVLQGHDLARFRSRYRV